MDILDTPGDWIELIVSAGFLFGLTIISSGMLMKNKAPQLIGVVIISFILWTQVYDYDLVLGYLLGSVLLVFYSGKQAGHYRNKDDAPQENRYVGALLMGAAVGVVMLVKIIFFFK